MQVETDNMILFWQADSIYSNWYPAKFAVAGVEFFHSEGAFIAFKAAEFGHVRDVRRIAALEDPKDAKAWGRNNIPNFYEPKWNEVRFMRMYWAVYHKFKQNPDLMEHLLATGDKLLVEASPYDKIWGIGLAPNDPKALDQSNWKGKNLLGAGLMELRHNLRLEK